ncbi:MAG: hypothetical protein AAF957_02980 [Planctomycetota bacterium]
MPRLPPSRLSALVARRPPGPLLLAALVYVLYRAWVVTTAFDAVAIPVYEVPNMGNQAWLLADGYRGVPWHYFYDNAGGQLLTGLLAAPLYALFGPTYLSLKLVPFLLGLGLLALVWRFLDRQAGRTAATLGAFAFALAPPTLSKYSLLAKGNHFEGLFFLFLPVVLAFESIGRERRAPWLFATGVAAGFAVAVYFGSLLTLALLLLALLRVRGVHGVLADLRWTLPGLLVGALPLAWIHAVTGGRAGDFALRFSTPDPGLDAGGMWAEARSLLVRTLPDGACFEPVGPLPASVGEWLLLGTMAVAWIGLAVATIAARRREDDASRRLSGAAILAAAYLPLVLGVIAVGVLKIRSMPPPVEIGGVRYLVSYYFYGVLACALAVGALERARFVGARTAARAIAVGLALTWPFVLSVGTGAFERAADGVRYPGTFLRNYGSLFHRDAAESPLSGRIELDAEHVVRVARQFEGRAQRDILFSVGNSLAYTHLAPKVDRVARTMEQRALDLDLLLEPYPDEWAPWLLRGVGANLRTRIPAGAPVPRPVAGWLGAALGDPARREWIAEGLGMSLEYPLRRTFDAEISRTERALEEVPPGLRAAVRRGQGIDLGVRLRIGLEGSNERIRAAVDGVADPEGRAALRASIEAEAGRAISAR